MRRTLKQLRDAVGKLPAQGRRRGAARLKELRPAPGELIGKVLVTDSAAVLVIRNPLVTVSAAVLVRPRSRNHCPSSS